MKKILIFIVILLLISAGIYFYTKDNAQSPISVNQQETLQTNSANNLSGKYVSDSALINITQLDSKTLVINGNATWEGENPGQVNSGMLEGTTTLNGNKAVYDDGTCRVELTFSGTSLEAEDNYKCGGLNVSFSGSYTKE